MNLADQVPALLGVLVGAATSYLTTSLGERARWRRTQTVRWDERRLTAYADYAHAVKEMVALASRISAARGLTPHPEPLDPETGIPLLAEAEAQRTVLNETLRLLGDPATVRAARRMNECAWQLERFARGRDPADAAAWQRADTAYRGARDEYIRRARSSLGVAGVLDPSHRTSWQPEPPAREDVAGEGA